MLPTKWTESGGPREGDSSAANLSCDVDGLGPAWAVAREEDRRGFHPRSRRLGKVSRIKRGASGCDPGWASCHLQEYAPKGGHLNCAVRRHKKKQRVSRQNS